MRILIVHNEYSAPSGEEHALRAIAGLLEENGHQVSWFLRSSADIKGTKAKSLAFFSGIHSPGAVKALRRFLQEHAVDVALVQNLYPLLSPSILPVFRQADIPVVMRCPNYRLFCPIGLHLYRGKICERCLNGREYWCLLRNCENNLSKSAGYALRNATARISRRIVDNVGIFVVLSEFQRQRFIAGGILPERLAVVPNVAPSATNGRSDDLGSMVSFVGRVSPEKGIADFLDTAARLPNIPFAVAGGYEQMPGLAQKSSANVRWMGFLTGKDLEAFYRESRLLVFPGRCFEGFPNVITGAMALGKPIIASRLGGVSEIVEHEKTGLLFEPGNISDLTASIKRLYTDPVLCARLGQAGRKKAETDYSRNAVYERWREVLGRALDAKPL
ncbi:MAG: glycosyltransferase family 4 protein [Proteobacteria bacterium]|nr:glycosyltransferase family 4 protein [Pseudomonadota bacterium]